jgi:hypothetical protein
MRTRGEGANYFNLCRKSKLKEEYQGPKQLQTSWTSISWPKTWKARDMSSRRSLLSKHGLSIVLKAHPIVREKARRKSLRKIGMILTKFSVSS